MTYNLTKAEVFAAFCAGLISMTVGINSGFGTVSLAYLDLDENLGSWFVSIEFFIAIPIAPLGGLAAGWLGRKKTVLIFSPLISMGWILIGVSTSKFQLFLGRVLVSLASSVIMAIPSKDLIDSNLS